MKTKHLLYTLALAGTFTACTQDEFVTENGSNPLEGRKSLGKITLVEGDAPSTRWSVDNFNTITPEVGDGFSYLLVDVPRSGLDGQHDYPIDNYELVNSIHTNYVFKKSSNGWDSEAELVEGNYLLIGPAQENKGDRKPVEIVLPTEQNLSLGTDGKLDPLSAIKEFVESKYPIYIGHRFLSDDEEHRSSNNILPARYNIFAYPEITIKNTDAFRDQTAVLTKVIIKQNDATKPFIINAPLNNVAAARLLTNESFKAKDPDTKNQFVVGEWEAYMNETLGMGDLTVKQESDNSFVNGKEIPANATYEITDPNDPEAWTNFMYNNGLHGATSDLLGTPQSTSQYIVINMPGDGIALKYGESITFNAIIPAGQYEMTTAASPDRLTIYAVLDNGEAYKKVMKSNSDKVDIYPGKRYPNQDYTGTAVKSGKGLYFTVDVCDGASDGVSTYKKVNASDEFGGVTTVKSTADLVAAIKAHTSTEVLNITVEGKDVVYNDEVNKAVANTSCQIVKIQGHIKIEGDGTNVLTINDKVSIEDAVVEKGSVVYTNNDNAVLGKVLVNKNASLELHSTSTQPANTTAIYNVGTLELWCTDFTKVDNYGKLQVYTDVTNTVGVIENKYAACGDAAEIISPNIKLEPSVEIMAVNNVAAGKYALSGNLDYPIVVNKDGNKTGVLDLTDDVTIVEKGKITNNGTISSSTGKTLTVQKGLGETLTNGTDGTINSKVIIEAASHTLAQMPVAFNEYKAAAQVTNNGTMKDVQVDGLLIMGNANARVTTVEDTSKGEIDNTAKGVIGTTMSSITGDAIVFANISSLDLSNDDAKTATLAALKAFTGTVKQVTVFRLNGTMTIGDAADLTTNTLNKTEIGTGNYTLELLGGKVNIGENAAFTTNLNVTLKANGITWNGRTTTASKIRLGGTNKLGQYINPDYADNQYKAITVTNPNTANTIKNCTVTATWR